MANSSPSLNDIAFQIAGLTYNISNYLQTNSLTPPGFSVDAPSSFPASAPADIQAARQQLLELTLNLHNLILCPEDRIRTQTAEFVAPAALRWITHFKIAEHVPQNDSISYTDLASAAAVPEVQLKRIVRYAMLNGYFVELTPGEISHSAMSLLLAFNPSLQDYVGHSIGFSYPVSTKLVEMTERYQGSDAKNETAFNVAHDTPLPMFAWLKGEPEHSARFGRLMGAMRAAPIYSVSHLVKGYDWDALGSGKVVDVGGSLGHTSLAIAERNPQLEFVVQDLPEVVEQGQAKTATELSNKLQFMAHDFFQEQPITDADTYLLRQILHDWPDAEATTILKNIVASMKPGAKIVIMDQVVPPPGLLPNSQEKAGRVIDLVVMSHFNGKQRDLDDWKKIFAAVDKRLTVSNLVVQPGSVLSIIELALHNTPVSNGHTESGELVVVNGVNGADEEHNEEKPTSKGLHNEPQQPAAEIAAQDDEPDSFVVVPAPAEDVAEASSTPSVAAAVSAEPIVELSSEFETSQGASSGGDVLAAPPIV